MYGMSLTRSKTVVNDEILMKGTELYRAVLKNNDLPFYSVHNKRQKLNEASSKHYTKLGFVCAMSQ